MSGESLSIADLFLLQHSQMVEQVGQVGQDDVHLDRI